MRFAHGGGQGAVESPIGPARSNPDMAARSATRRNARLTGDLTRSLDAEYRSVREDAGLSQSELSRGSGIDQGAISRFEAGKELPSPSSLVSLADALGGRLSMRLDPVTGPRIGDALQAPMVEAVIARAHARWRSVPEVAVYSPARGVIDLVLVDRLTPTIVAVEVHSAIRRLEQQLRWAVEKADALPSSRLRGAAAPRHDRSIARPAIDARHPGSCPPIPGDLRRGLPGSHRRRARSAHERTAVARRRADLERRHRRHGPPAVQATQGRAVRTVRRGRGDPGRRTPLRPSRARAPAPAGPPRTRAAPPCRCAPRAGPGPRGRSGRTPRSAGRSAGAGRARR